ncbi:hypothetical protein LCGC14_3152550, partial [marine sediment metagenome]
MNIDMSSVRTKSTSNSNGSSGNSLDARIATLKKKLVDLFNKIKEIGQNPTEESTKRAEMLQ